MSVVCGIVRDVFLVCRIVRGLCVVCGIVGDFFSSL